MIFRELRVPEFGYTAADPRVDLPPNALISGSQNLMFRGERELESVGGFAATAYGGSSNRGGDQSFLVGKGWATMGDQLNEGSGSIVEFVGRSLWFTGTGDITVYMPGITSAPQALGNSALQNNIPQVCVLNDTKNGYSVPFQIGLLAQSEAPILFVPTTPGVGIQGKMTGTYAIELTWLRDATGAESLPSEPSNVLSLTNQSVIIQFPTPTNSVNPRDKWRVYGSKSGFGATGPFFFFIEVPERRISSESGNGYALADSVTPGTFNVFTLSPTVTGFFSSEQIGKRIVLYDAFAVPYHSATITGVVDNTFTVKGVTYGDSVTFSPAAPGAGSGALNWGIDSLVLDYRQLEVEWSDNELFGIEPPTDYFPPSSTASFIAAMGNVMILIGTEDGLGVAISVPNFPEAFPPDFRVNLPEPPVGVLSRPQDGFLFVVCENSIHELRWSGATDGPPVSIRTVADLVGAAQQRAACQAGNSIYTFTKSRKPARILPDGTVDTTFGDRVELDMKAWDESKVVVSFDERKSYISYGYQDKMLLYYPAYDSWAAPVVTGSIESAGRPNGVLASSFTLKGLIHASYYNTRNVSVSWTGTSTITSSGGFVASDNKKVITIPGAGSPDLTAVMTYVNANTATLSLSTTGSGTASAAISGFDMYTFDRDTTNTELTYASDWVARYSFSDYGVGSAPKTVTKARVGMKGAASTHTLRFFRNYKTSSGVGNDRTFTAGSGSHLNDVVDCNNGEAELLSVQLSGTGSRSKLFFIELEGDYSGIITNHNV